MFQGLFRRAERSIDQVVSKYVGRAMVAIPLLIAAGFATAAVTVKLVELYGSVVGYGIMAAAFAVIGLITMVVVDMRLASPAQPDKVEEPEAAKQEEVGDEPSLTESLDMIPPELKSVLASAAPVALPGIARAVGRNLPLLLLLAIVGYVISRFAETGSQTSPDEAAPSSSQDEVDQAVAAASTAAAAAA